MNKFPELKTLPTQEEIDELKKRITELAVQAEQFKETARQYTELAARGIYYTLEELAEHDREVAARAGRAGFVAGCDDMGDNDWQTQTEIIRAADRYASKIKSGEVEV